MYNFSDFSKASFSFFITRHVHFIFPKVLSSSSSCHPCRLDLASYWTTHLDKVVRNVKLLWFHVRARAELFWTTIDTFPLPPVQMSVDGVKHGHCVACKQAGPLHGIHYPLHGASHEGYKHCGVVSQQHQIPPQLPALVDDQVDSLVMSCHRYAVFCIVPDSKN